MSLLAGRSNTATNKRYSRFNICHCFVLLGLSGLASGASAQDARLVSYEELLDRVAALEEDMATPSVPDAPPIDTNTDDGGFYASWEHVFVTPYFGQNTAAVIVGPGSASRVQEFDWDIEYSPRFEIGNVDACDGTGWRARYWHFEHSNSASFGVPAGVSVTIAPGAFDSGIIGFAGDTVTAVHSLRMSVLDLEWLKRDITEDGGFTASAGVRYVRMDQHLRGRRVLAGVQVENLSQHHDFEGIGPTIAAEYLTRFDCSYWGAFINGRGALLYGESNVRGDRRVGGVIMNNTSDSNDQDLMSVVELQIGLDYRRPSGCHEMFLRVALEAQYWANAGSASAGQAPVGDANAQDTDLGFLGVTIATGLDW